MELKRLLVTFFNFLNVLLSIVGIIIYIFTTYHPNTVLRYSKIFFSLNFSIRIIFFINFLFELSYNKKYDDLYAFIKYIIIEISNTVPYFISRITVGFKEDLINNTHNICSALICLRIFRILMFSKYIRSDVNRELYIIVCNIFCLFITLSILLNVIENTQTIGKYWLFLERDCYDNYNCDGVNDTFLSSLYFVIMTAGTVGFYSTITSVAGRLVVIILIFISFFEIPSQCVNLISQLSSKSVYARTSYKIVKNVEFILITGNITPGSITVLLQEYFHPDHGENEKHALVLQPTRPDDNIKYLLKKYEKQLFYYEGSPTKLNDLQRCQFNKASMIMILCNKQTDAPLVEDSQTIIKAITIKRLLTQNEEENGKESYKNKKEDKIEMKEIDDEEKEDDPNIPMLSEGKHLSNGVEPRIIMQVLKPESEHHFSLSNPKRTIRDQILSIDEVKLSLLAKNCLCPGIITLMSNLIITNNFEEEIERKIGKYQWIEEYKHGKDYEIYKIPLDYLKGYKFSVCAEKIYNEKKTILFGLNIEEKINKMNVILLSPMEFVLPIDNEIKVYGYLLAKDQNDADSVTTWAKTQKRMLITTQIKMNKFVSETERFNRNFDYDEENNIETDRYDKGKNIYSTDAFKFARTCHITIEHIPKSSVIISSTEKMLIVKDHIIICGICNNLINFIKPLRAKHLPKNKIQTIVILSKEIPDDTIWNSIAFFEQIYIVQGDPTKSADLKRAGIKYAKRAVILAPSVQEISDYVQWKAEKNDNGDYNSVKGFPKLTAEEDLLDYKTIIKYNTIVHINKDIFCVVELINPKNIGFFNNKVRKNHDEYQLLCKGLDIDATASFAAGEIYYSSIMDNLITQAYYNPSVVDVFKKLIIGEDSNTLSKSTVLNKYSNVPSGNIYLIDMPVNLFNNLSELDGYVKFEDVFKILLSKRILVIGIYRAGNIQNNLDNDVSEDIKLSSSKKLSKGNFYYVVTAPDGEFNVTRYDKLFVISTEYPDITNNFIISGHEENENILTFNFNKKNEENLKLKKEIDEEGEKKFKLLQEKYEQMNTTVNEIKRYKNYIEGNKDSIIKNGVVRKIGSLVGY